MTAEQHGSKTLSCLVCEKPDAKHCERCRSSTYCSRACQEEDWPFHKLLCKIFSEFDKSSRPSEHHCLGFIFPEDKKRPYCDWIHIHKQLMTYDDKKWYEIDRIEYKDSETGVTNFGGPGMGRCLDTRSDFFFQRRLPDTLSIHYADVPARPNRFVEELRQSHDPIRDTLNTMFNGVDCVGPLFACCWEAESFEGAGESDEDLTKEELAWEVEKQKLKGFRRDLNMNDFRHICHRLLET